MPRNSRNNVNDEGGVGLRNENASNEGCNTKDTLKKGPWTTQEDGILIEYVKKCGEGNWNSVHKHSGLARCGKSCRLRWANHLRPNLKKGAFSADEEKLIVELHAKLGNKWARMASQLPGRTDNEIKNFWNTRMKRRQRAGLPLYPQDVQDEADAYHVEQNQPFTSSFNYSSILSNSYRQKLNQLRHSADKVPQQDQSDSTVCTNLYQKFKIVTENNENETLQGLPLSPVSSPYGASSSTLFCQGFGDFSVANDSHDYNSGSYNYDFTTMGSLSEPFPLMPSLKTEQSSSLTPPGSETSASSYTSGVDGFRGASTIANDYYELAPLTPPEANSGLLEALVIQGRALCRNDNKSKSEHSTNAEAFSVKGKAVAADEYAEEEDTVPVESAMKNVSGDTAKNELSSSQSSKGKKRIAEDPLMEEMNSMDDDLFGLLNNYPSEMPMPEWYRRGEGQSLGIETQRDASAGPTDQELAWTLGTCWNNMPGIC